jgi:hypothetical protein
MLRNCWEKDGNKGKRPNGWSNGKEETANAAVDTNSDFEMMICHIDGYSNDDESVHSYKEWDQELDARDAHYQVHIRLDDMPIYLDDGTNDSVSENPPHTA